MSCEMRPVVFLPNDFACRFDVFVYIFVNEGVCHTEVDIWTKSIFYIITAISVFASLFRVKEEGGM